MNMTAKPVTGPIAGLAALPTVFGPNLYLRPAEGMHLPTFAEQALAWNQQSSQPAERIVIKAEQWKAAPSLPTTDAEQLSRLAQRFQTAIDLKSRGGVQEFVFSEELSRQQAVGSMAAAGTKKLGGFMLRNKIRAWLLEERSKRLDEDTLPDDRLLRDDFSGYESHVLVRQLFALTLMGEKDSVRIEAVREIRNLGRNCEPDGVSDDQWKNFHVDIIHDLVASKDLPWKAGRLLQRDFEYHSYVPGDAADRNELEGWAWRRDVFIRVLNDPDEARRKRARDFFDAHEWIKDARPVAIKP